MSNIERLVSLNRLSSTVFFCFALGKNLIEFEATYVRTPYLVPAQSAFVTETISPDFEMELPSILSSSTQQRWLSGEPLSIIFLERDHSITREVRLGRLREGIPK